MSKQKFGINTDNRPERAILVGIDRGKHSWPLDESLFELSRLADTAGAEVIATISQKLETPNPRTFIGKGKVEQLIAMVNKKQADLVIIDDELTPSQQSNLEKLIGKPIKIIDRTALILDIFALHAKSREGRLQVQLAQNKYLYPRLRGMWSHLASNRMGGGVGSRFGEGESQLEVDRRIVRKRILKIRRALENVTRMRDVQRKSRKRCGVFRVALAGYTNAGKSSLMNALTDSAVEVYDKLFVTLDSTTRQLELKQGCKVTLTDTVGFIEKLPHELIEAFHSTLDEICEADLVLLVVDVAASQRDAQLASVRTVLDEIGAAKIETVVVYNKVDLMKPSRLGELTRLRNLHTHAIFTSARNGVGLDAVREIIVRALEDKNPVVKVFVSYDQGDIIQKIHKYATVLFQEYTDKGVRIEIRVPKAYRSMFSDYEIAD